MLSRIGQETVLPGSMDGGNPLNTHRGTDIASLVCCVVLKALGSCVCNLCGEG